MNIDLFHKLSARVKASLLRSLIEHRYEKTPDGGLYIPRERAVLRGVFSYSFNGGPKVYAPNTVVREGRNHMLNVTLHNQAQMATWYMALFGADVAVNGNTWTAANFSANAGEIVDYDEADRPSFDEGAAADGVLNNGGNEATFTFNGAGTAYGGAILSSSTKGGTTGLLFSAARFPSAKPYEPSDKIKVGYEIALTSS